MKKISKNIVSIMLVGIVATSGSVFAAASDYKGAQGISLIEQVSSSGLTVPMENTVKSNFEKELSNIPTERVGGYVAALYYAQLADAYVKNSIKEINNITSTEVQTVQRYLTQINDTKIGYRYSSTGEVYGQASPLVIKLNVQSGSTYVADILKIIQTNYNGFGAVPVKERFKVDQAMDASVYLDRILSDRKFGVDTPKATSSEVKKAVSILNASAMGVLIRPETVTEAYLEERSNKKQTHTSAVHAFFPEVKVAFANRYTDSMDGSLTKDLELLKKENATLEKDLEMKRLERQKLEGEVKNKEEEAKKKQEESKENKALLQEIQKEKDKQKQLTQAIQQEQSFIQSLQQKLKDLQQAISDFVRNLF